MAREYSFNDPDRPRWCDDDPNPHLRPAPDADVARSIAAEEQRLSGQGFVSQTRNFLPPEQRISRTTHFGDPERAVELPLDRRHQERLERAAAARQIAAAQRLAGSHTTTTRGFDTSGFRSNVRRDHLGRLVIDWSRADVAPAAVECEAWPSLRTLLAQSL